MRVRGFRQVVLGAAGMYICAAALSLLSSRNVTAQPSAPAGRTPALANVNDLMRSLLFPTANQIFDVQVRDPGEAAPSAEAASTQNASPSVRFGSVYTPWEQVEYAAVALSESAVLLRMPSRQCGNGKPAPVEGRAWVSATDELVAVATRIRDGARGKNRDAIVDATDALSEACLTCHQVYRDRPGVDRCTP